MTQWPYEETEKRKAFNDYRTSGGTLDWYAWLESGEPSINEATEANILGYLGYLDRYLASEIAAGVLNEGQASAILNDEYNQMYGYGAYEGDPKPFFQMPNYNKVTSYLRGLPIQEQRMLEEEARAKQQQAQDIASQRTQLPLGAGGTIPQQIQSGQLAIRNLQLQLSSAPDYMKNTINEQIAELWKGISQLQETDLLMTKERSIQKRWTEEVPAPPTYAANQRITDTAEKYSMSPEAAVKTAVRYRGNPASEEFANLTEEEKRDLTAVSDEVGDIDEGGKEDRPVPVKPFEDMPTFDELGTSGSPAWKRWFEQRYPTIVSQFRGKEAKERTETGWTGFLEKERARIKAEFTQQSPYARGESPGAFQPRIKTVAW